MPGINPVKTEVWGGIITGVQNSFVVTSRE